MMNQRLPYLLDRYLNKSCSGNELTEFYALVNDPANEKEFDDLLSVAISSTTGVYRMGKDRKPAMLQDIFNNERGQIPVTLPLAPKRNWIRLTSAAAILLVVGAALYIFNVQYPSDLGAGQLVGINNKAGILPGSNKAVLTLGDGTAINLQDVANGKLANEGDVLVMKSQNGQLIYSINKEIDRKDRNLWSVNTLTTPRGGQYQLNLPDGTKVWLNAASTLKFPSTFTGLNQRKVELSGEAYFEVAKIMVSEKGAKGKDIKLPFVVVTGSQKVEVLGTHFNVNAYIDEGNTRTTLLEGAVKVTDDERRTVILKPGQQSLLNKDALVVQQADLEKSIDWKSGKFIFKNESLESIMRKVARWYDVKVVYAVSVPKEETFSGTVSRFDDVGKLLRRLELTGEVSFKINGKTITVLR